MVMGGVSLFDQARVFANESESIDSLDTLKDRLGALVEKFGYPYIASGRLAQTGLPEALHFARWRPDWLALYMREDFVRVDPVPLWAATRGTPIGARALRRLLPRNHPGQSVFEAGERFGLGGGYIVPQRAADNAFGVVAFVGASDPDSAEDRFALRALAGVAFDLAEALSGRSSAPWLPAPPAALSNREREVLLHLIRGRSAAQTATILALSAATVRFHVANLKIKTGASNLAQLTAYGISLGLTPWREPVLPK